MNLPCSTGYTQLIINSDLSVATCDIALSVTVGSLKTHTIKEVWDSLALQTINGYPVWPCILNLALDKREDLSRDSSLARLDVLRTTGNERLTDTIKRACRKMISWIGRKYEI